MTTATDAGFVEMRIAKVVGLGAAEDELVHCVVVLDEVAGDRNLAILIGQPEAFSLSARLGGITWPRPMTYQLTAALVQALGGRIRQVRIDRLVEEEVYGATVEVEGPLGMQSVDARPSDVLNLATIPLAYALGVLGLGQLYAVAFLVGTLSALFTLSQATPFVAITPRERYIEANAVPTAAARFCP